MRFQQFPTKPWQDILPGASAAAIDFVSKTVCFESTSRLIAAEVGFSDYHRCLGKIDP